MVALLETTGLVIGSFQYSNVAPWKRGYRQLRMPGAVENILIAENLTLRAVRVSVAAAHLAVESSLHTLGLCRCERSHLRVSTIATTWRIRSVDSGSTDLAQRCGESEVAGRSW